MEVSSVNVFTLIQYKNIISQFLYVENFKASDDLCFQDNFLNVENVHVGIKRIQLRCDNNLIERDLKRDKKWYKTFLSFLVFWYFYFNFLYFIPFLLFLPTTDNQGSFRGGVKTQNNVLLSH